MTIPFKVKLLTNTAKAPERANEGDLWDLFADEFCLQHLEDRNATMYRSIDSDHVVLSPMGRILVKTGVKLELPKQYDGRVRDGQEFWEYQELNHLPILSHAVADIRPRSGLALKHGITVLNSPGTIDNSYRKEIGVILYNAGHEPYTITKGDKIAQMLIRPLYPSKMEIVEHIEDTGRGAYGSTDK